MRTVQALLALTLAALPLAAATITVTGTGDTIAADGAVTLREAITSVNAAADVNADVAAHRTGAYGSADAIHFAIGTGAQTIAPSYPLPTLAVTVIIDATTQPGYASAPLITIDGSGAGSTTSGLIMLAGTQSVARGLRIRNFGYAGILMGTAGTDHSIPVAVNQSVVTVKNQPIGITLDANDGGDPALTFAIGTHPAHGAISGFQPATGALTYTPTAGYAGPDQFTFTASDGTNTSAPATVSITVVDGVPQNLVAAGTSTTQIDLTWGAVPGATYQIDRKSAGADWQQIATPGTNSFSNTGLTPGSAHLYRVRSVLGGVPSANSDPDLATTVVFSDHPLTAGVFIKAEHLSQLRVAVLAVKALAGQSAPSFTGGNAIAAVHFIELRFALNEARGAMGLSTGGYTDDSLAGVVVKATHVSELRSRVQ